MNYYNVRDFQELVTEIEKPVMVLKPSSMYHLTMIIIRRRHKNSLYKHKSKVKN